MKTSELKTYISNNELDEKLRMLYGVEDISDIRNRYLNLLDESIVEFGEMEDVYLISSPGRSEVGGNHTDHQQGRVLAASVNMDIIALVSLNKDLIEYKSKDFNINTIDIKDLEIRDDEASTSEALIRGIAYKFKALGYKIGGFKAYCQSNVLPGSGVSSSAAFEVLIGNILSHLYNKGEVSPIEIAKIGKYAENVYFKKPSGLLDQMACSVGGFVTIDFKDVENPLVEAIDYDFSKSGYSLCIVDTKGSHAGLSDEYGAMPKEMKEVAGILGQDVLSKLTIDDLMKNIKQVRNSCSDRAILRSIHFFNENERVLKEVDALKNHDMEEFKKLIIESGYSSYMYLQNVYISKPDNSQELSLALALSEEFLRGKGAYRVHGGGIAGTIQAFVPNDMVENYKGLMEEVFGEKSCHILQIRPVGGYRLI